MGKVILDDSQLRGDYTPSNFDNNFNGKVSLKEALTRSLNIPAIETLELIGANSFENNLRNFIGQDVGHTNEAGLTLVGGLFKC